MDYDALMKQIAEKRVSLGQRVADTGNVEAKLRESLFGNDPVTNNLAANENAKIQELYAHDKVLADRYANPTSEAYLADPYAREKARAVHFGGTASELNAIQSQKQQRRDVLGDALEKAMKLVNYGLEAQKLEYEGMRDELHDKMELEKFQLEKKKAAKGTEADQQAAMYDQMTAEMRKGMTLSQALAKYRKWFDPTDIYGVYNSVNTGASRKTFDPKKGGWGRASEPTNVLAEMGIERYDQKVYKPEPVDPLTRAYEEAGIIPNSQTVTGTNDPLGIRNK